MAEIKSTRIRYVKSKQLDKLVEWVDSLPFKIEIKGNPVFQSRKWHLFFILPESDNPAFSGFFGIDLDS